MRRQKCSQCGSMLDITQLEKGSKFACANCGTILVAGDVSVAKRSLHGAGPAFEPKTGKEKAAPEPARRSRAAEAEPPAKSSRLPLVLGLGAVVVAGIVIAVVMGGGDGGGGTGRGGAASRGGGGGNRRSATTPADWWAGKSAQLDGASATTLRSWIFEAKTNGYDRDPAFWGPREAELYRALLRRDPEDEDANQFAGRKSLSDYPSFRAVWAEMNENFGALSKEQKEFLDQYAERVDSGKRIWLDPSDYDEAKGHLDAFDTWNKERKNNPAIPKIRKGIAEASAILKNREFVPVVQAPFILLLAYPKEQASDEGLRKGLEERGKKYAAALAVFREAFDKRFRQPLNLPEMEKSRFFYQLVTTNSADFGAFLRGGEGYDVTGDVPAFFSPRTRWAGIQADGKDEASAAGDLAHEAVHQLHWYFSRDPKRKFLNYFDEWTGIWFTEGWAEYAGGVVLEGGKPRFTGRPPRRVQFLKAMRDNGAPFIPLRDLVQFPSFEAFSRYVFGTWLPLIRDDEDMPESVGTWLGQQGGGLPGKVLYAQAWYLAYFLNEFEDGKYRAKYLDLVLTALRGKQKPEKYRKSKTVAERWSSAYDAFVEIFELKDDKAWKKLQREHDRFLRKTLRG